jgi:hypothetical protein
MRADVYIRTFWPCGTQNGVRHLASGATNTPYFLYELAHKIRFPQVNPTAHQSAKITCYQERRHSIMCAFCVLLASWHWQIQCYGDRNDQHTHQ